MNTAPTNLIDDLRLLQASHPLGLVEWLVIVLVVVGVACLIIWHRGRARRQQPLTQAAIQEAQEDALAELQKLRSMIAVKNSRPYAIEVSGVVRRYIERRFGIRAPRRSTEEFLLEAKESSRLDQGHQRNLGKFLAACDFLKFARAFGEIPELEEIHQAAVRFVMDTQEAEKMTAQPVEAK